MLDFATMDAWQDETVEQHYLEGCTGEIDDGVVIVDGKRVGMLVCYTCGKRWMEPLPPRDG